MKPIEDTDSYSRSSPSPRYKELLEQYRFLHENGEIDRQVPAENTFEGSSALPQSTRIKRLVDMFGAKSLLDYGAGKGKQYEIEVEVEGNKYQGLQEYWNIEELYRYDPAYAPFTQLPNRQYDAVICTDVIEHIPETDVEWVLDEIFSYSKKFVFINIACYPAKKTLPNGENAHCTTYTEQWWAPIFQILHNKYPDIKFEVWLHSVINTPDGIQKTDFRMTNI